MLTDAFLSRLDAMSLAMRGRARGGAGGVRKSRQLGSSAEFSDYREYIPGDDIRRLDWNALARFDRLFVKLYMEEQESAVTVLLDGSASMAAKWDAACRAAETLGYLALTGGDRLRVRCLKEGGGDESRLLSGRQAYPELSRFVAACTPDGKGSVAEAVRRLQGLRKGLCFLITDGYTEDGLKETLDSLRFHQQECGVIQVLSPFELRPELEGAVRLEDSEGGDAVDVLADRDALNGYQKTLQAFLADLRQNCAARQVPCLLLDSGDPFEETFLPLLRRAGLLGGGGAA